MREISKLVALTGGIAFAATLAHAANQTILGKSLTVKDPTAGVQPAKRSIKGAAKGAKGSSDTLVGDPTLAGSAGGALLDIFANGTHSTAQEFVLPQGTSKGKPFWSVIGTNDNPTGYRYKDADGANSTPVKSVLIKKSANGVFSIKVKLSGKNGTINVVPPNTGISGCMALKLGQSAGAGDRYSVQFGPESKIKNVDSKVFSAKKPTLEGICPLVVATTSTTTTTVATSSTSTTTTHGGTTTTTMYGSPSRAFLEKVEGLLD
jgi:hypothetical protein